MEPERVGQPKAPEPGAERKPKRFRIVKLEERIAPSKGGQATRNSCANCAYTAYCYHTAVCCGGGTVY